MVKMAIVVLDPAGKPTPTRVSVTAEDGRAYAPDDAWMQADDSFVRSERAFEAHYFAISGKAIVEVPPGNVRVEAMKGFEYRAAAQTVHIGADESAKLTIRLQPQNVPQDTRLRWVSGDVHVHMNYGGTYRNTPAHLVAQAAAENLAIVEDLIVNKEQRIPDENFTVPPRIEPSDWEAVMVRGQEFHTSYWGHLGLLGLTGNFLIPGYAAYSGTAAASLFPTNANAADMAHDQRALVGYVHPFDAFPDPAKDASLTDELPVDIALGKVDYMEIVGFSDHRSTAEVWYRLLNLGFHLPTAAGTDAMANYASLRGPVGLNRVYVKVPQGPLNISSWLGSLKQGHTFATNGPLLGFTLDNKEPGDEIKLPAGENKLRLKVWLRSIVPVDHLQVVCNGTVVRDLKMSGDRQIAEVDDTIPISRSGWCLLRAWSEKAEHPILDLYPYATTSPIYVSVAGSSPRSPSDAAYFIAWIDRLAEAARSNQDWNTEAEKTSVLDLLEQARDIYVKLQR